MIKKSATLIFLGLAMSCLTMAADLAAGRGITDSQYQSFVAVIAQIKTAHQTLTEQFDLRADTVRSLGGVAVDP